MRPYAMDLRLKVAAAWDRGEPVSTIARTFALAEKTVRRYLRRAAEGGLEPARSGPPRAVGTKLTDEDVAVLERAVEVRPGITLRELVALVGGKAVQSTICRVLRRLGYRYKKSRWRRGDASGPTCANAGGTSPSPARSWGGTSSCSSTRPASAPT